jgi:hypothetical protein
MSARALFAGMALAVALASPASAKGAIVEATIIGPGLEGIDLSAPETDGMWRSGIMDDSKLSLSDYGLTTADLGPRYAVTYRFDLGPGTRNDVLRQDLYPYAEDGPVTFTPPGQAITGSYGNIRIVSGWWKPLPGFLEYLVSKGLPAANPVAAAIRPAPDADPAPGTPATQAAPWAWILLGLAGLAALSLTAPSVRRRALPGVNH